MHIFIDETGTFTGIGKPMSISMIGALIVPDSRKRSLEREYGKLRKYLPTEGGEVKGKRLSQKDIARLMPILRHHDVIFEVAAIDLGIHSEEGIWRNQTARAEAMTANLTEEHHPALVDAVWKARRELETYSLQLNIQSAILFELIDRVLEHGTMFYSQRRPGELANFHWIIDAKGDNSIPTPWEQWWSTFTKPALQSKMARDPYGIVEDRRLLPHEAIRIRGDIRLSPETSQSEAGWAKADEPWPRTIRKPKVLYRSRARPGTSRHPDECHTPRAERKPSARGLARDSHDHDPTEA